VVRASDTFSQQSRDEPAASSAASHHFSLAKPPAEKGKYASIVSIGKIDVCAFVNSKRFGRNPDTLLQ